MSTLFSALKVKNITFKNRIAVSPMCQYSAFDGMANDWHLVHLGSRAVGGASLIISEATAVSPEGRITPHDTGLWQDTHIAPLRRITDFIKGYGAVPAIQLAHAGRKGSAARPWEGGKHLRQDEGGYNTVGPANEAFDDERLWKKPQALDAQGIQRIQQAFLKAAERALEAGYEMIEIHAAHGYLLHSFCSPLINNRNDNYGGSLKNRARMLLETTQKVRKVWPDHLPLAVRLSTTDWDEHGLSVTDSIQIASWLKDEGVDLIDCSSGGATPRSRTSISGQSNNQIDIAADIRAGADIMTMAVGNITEAKQAEAIIQEAKADMCLLAREFIRDPYWPYHAAQALKVDTKSIMPPQNSFWV